MMITRHLVLGSMRLLVAATFVLTVFPFGIAADVVPHQAIYRLSLSDSSPPSRFTGLTGAFVSVTDRTCKGWEINEQLVMRLSTAAGGVIDQELTFKASESFDGRDFVFDSQSNTNGSIDGVSGSARREQDSSAEAEYVTPKPFEMPLPDGTLFYVGFSNWLLGLAKAGEKTGMAPTFDGTDDDGPRQVTAFILPDKDGPPARVAGDDELLSGKAWRVRLAFFEIEGQTANPEFEIALRMLENGVITNYELIFDDLVVDQILEDVTPAKDEQCN